MTENRSPIEVSIGSYCDYFSFWYGLPDGTILSLTDERARGWVKVYGQLMTVEEFNAAQGED